MLTDISWDELLDECLTHDPEHDIHRTVKSALLWVRELNLLDADWRESQREFYSSGEVEFYGIEPDERLDLVRLPKPALTTSQTDSQPTFFW